MISKWLRTCQECIHKQEDKEPVYGTEPPDSYKFRKCKKCKSESLDYGSYFFYNEDGTEVVEEDEEI
jgi:hypothetical protein